MLAVAVDVEIEVGRAEPGREAVVLAQSERLRARDLWLRRLDRVERDEMAEQVASVARPGVGAGDGLRLGRLRSVGAGGARERVPERDVRGLLAGVRGELRASARVGGVRRTVRGGGQRDHG